MNRCEKAVEKHESGYNCAQAVAYVFADKLGYSEEELFRLTFKRRKISKDIRCC